MDREHACLESARKQNLQQRPLAIEARAWAAPFNATPSEELRWTQ